MVTIKISLGAVTQTGINLALNFYHNLTFCISDAILQNVLQDLANGFDAVNLMLSWRVKSAGLNNESDLARTYFDNPNSSVVPLYKAELVLGLLPAIARRRYKVTPSLIGWVQI